jgi:hypothetical protein
MKKLLFNPFEKIAGKEALYIGIAIAVIAAVIASLTSTRFDGVIDLHFVFGDVPLTTAITDQLINLGSLFISFYLMAIAFDARHTRPIDLIGTLAMARAPFLLAPLVNITGIMSNFSRQFENPSAQQLAEITPNDLLPLLPMLLVIIVLSIWMIALSFNAWKVSTNLKGTKLIVSFIIGLITAEILSKIFISII